MFEVLARESVVEFLRLAQPHDILVVSRADNPQEQLASSQLEAASESLSTTMLLPKRVMRRKGPVVGLALAGDSTLRVAASIAHAVGERLLLFFPQGGPDEEALLEAVRVAGVQPNFAELRRLPRIDTQSFLAALESIYERVIILPRLRGDAAGYVDPVRVASRRSAPVIIVDPLAIFES